MVILSVGGKTVTFASGKAKTYKGKVKRVFFVLFVISDNTLLTVYHAKIW